MSLPASALLMLCFACILSPGTAVAQNGDRKLQKTFVKPKSLRPKAYFEGDAEKAHETSKSKTSGGAINDATRYMREIETVNTMDQYNVNFAYTREERRSRWMKFFGMGKYAPNTPEQKNKKSKRDSRKVIKFRGDQDPKFKADPTTYTEFSGDRPQKLVPDHEAYTQYAGDRPPKIVPDHEAYTQFSGDLPGKMAPDHEAYTQFSGNLPVKKEPDHEAYTQYRGEIRVRKSGDRTQKPFYQRKVKTKPHYDKATESGIWND